MHKKRNPAYSSKIRYERQLKFDGQKGKFYWPLIYNVILIMDVTTDTEGHWKYKSCRRTGRLRASFMSIWISPWRWWPYFRRFWKSIWARAAKYIHIWNPAGTSKTYILPRLKDSAEDGDRFFSTKTKNGKIDEACRWAFILGRLLCEGWGCPAKHGSDELYIVGVTCFQEAAFCHWYNGKVRHCNMYETFFLVTWIHTHSLIYLYNIARAKAQRHKYNNWKFLNCY